MSKRARWDGAEDVRVFWPAGQIPPEKEWTVKPGAYLPDDAPAALRDELTSRDNWTEVAYTAPGAKKEN